MMGLVAALAVVVISVLTATKNVHVFLDFHGILCVIGGTAAAALLCFPLKFFLTVGKVFVKKFLGSYETECNTVISELVDLARGVREKPDYFKQKSKSIKTPFLSDAVELIVQGGIPDDALDAILLKRAATHSKRYEYDVGVFKTIAKFPPAFGLMGTTLGMISLLQQLGSKDAQKLLGPAMAVGLVATFYGIVLSNMFFIPISEKLGIINRQDETIRTICIDGLRLIRHKAHPKIVEEHLKSYLLPSERALLKTAAKSAAAAPEKA
jgi:chemotaxis protein MotA